MLRLRLISATVLIVVVASLCWADLRFGVDGAAGVWLLPLLMFFSLGTAWDFTRLLSGSNRLVSRRSTLIATGVITLSAAVPMLWPIFGSDYPALCPVGRLGWLAMAVVGSVMGILIGEMVRYGRGPGGAVERAAHGVFIAVYVGVPMALLVSLRSLGDWTGGTDGSRWGLMALVTMIAVTKSSDAGAYFTGKTLGRHKLIPRLSPGKTREGSAGGIVASTVAAFLCLRYLMPEVGHPPGTASIGFLAGESLRADLIASLILGPLLAVSGMIGDLAESLVKRDCGAKDSGQTLPGLGGVWDVTDSLIAAVMPAYLCFAAGVGW